MTHSNAASTPDISWDELVRAAVAARAAAYAPYSNFHVGAALLAPDGTIYPGANIENASYGLTLCAERVAMAQALMAGHRSAAAIAVASEGGIAPCGACRQFLAEFTVDALVAMIDTLKENSIQIVSMSELLPLQFTRRSWKR